jgi:hypothetical protein
MAEEAFGGHGRVHAEGQIVHVEDAGDFELLELNPLD